MVLMVSFNPLLRLVFTIHFFTFYSFIRITLGRTVESPPHIRFDDKRVSSVHAEIHVKGNNVMNKLQRHE
jgi:hypothetical protein